MSVPNLININSIHLQFLAPLLKWRILDLNGLRQEGEYPSHHTVFEKMIRRLEKAQVLKSFKDPWSRKKYIYLSSIGEKLINNSGRPISLNDETMFHDAKVTQLTRLMMERTCFEDVIIEHLIKDSQNLRGQQPDAIISGLKRNKKFKMAFELELSRKSKDRIKTKISRYLESSYYDYVFYLFSTQPIMNSYYRFIEEEFGENAFKKIMLFWNPSIMSRKIDLNSGVGIFKSKEVRFDELF